MNQAFRSTSMPDATEPTSELGFSPGTVFGVGVLQVVLGTLAILLVGVVGLLMAVVLGCAIVAAGIVVLLNAFAAPAGGGRIWRFIGGLVAVLAGAFIALDPVVSLVVVTMLLAWYLLLDGVIKVSWAFDQRPDPAWSWTLLSGLAGVVLGLLIWLKWPSSAEWVVGLFVGINLILSGWAMIMFGSAAKRLDETNATAGGA
jgi:uncharacterized membrane protein HdeD (DUF308 family)